MDQDKQDQEQPDTKARVIRKTDDGKDGWHEEPMTVEEFVRQVDDLSKE